MPLPGTYDPATGIWSRIADGDAARRRPAIFLDRDGTIVEEVDYLHQPAETRLLPGAADLIAAANREGVAVVVVTNQSGIGRGKYAWRNVELVHQTLDRDLEAAGARIDGAFACPFHADADAPYRHPDHPARKPNPGMLRAAAELMAIDLGASWVIGNRASDLAAARTAGCAGGIHVTTGHGAMDSEAKAALAVGAQEFPVHAVAAIAECARLLPFFA